VLTAEHRRPSELLGGLDAGLQFALGLAAAALWAIMPAELSTHLFGATLSIYRYVPADALLGLAIAAGIFVPLLFGLVFRYVELWLGSYWAVVVVVGLYVADTFRHDFGVSPETVVWPLLTATIYALSYLLTRRLWLPIALRIGEALYFTTAPILTLDIVHVRLLSRWDYDELLHLGLLAVAAFVLTAVAWRRGAFVSRLRAWPAQTGLPVTLGTDADREVRVGDAGLWAAFGCAFLLGMLDSFAGWRALWLCTVTLAYWAFVHFAERRRCDELRGGLGALGQGAAGLAWGVVLALIPPAAVALGSGPGLEAVSLPVRMVAVYFLLALSEELLWRGLLLRYLEPRIGSGMALVATAIGFAAWHLTWNPVYLLHLAAAGAMFGAAYLCTRRLWLSVGLHAGWNLTLAVLWTGDTGFTLPSYATVLVLQVLAMAVLLVVAHRRCRLVPAPWVTRRRTAEVEAAASPAEAVTQIVSGQQ
jgi:membrane protease YdiL (CAAX protease family)